MTRDRWFTSSHSSGGQACVEVRCQGGLVSIRDTKYGREAAHHRGARPMLTVPATAWTAFLADIPDTV